MNLTVCVCAVFCTGNHHPGICRRPQENMGRSKFTLLLNNLDSLHFNTLNPGNEICNSKLFLWTPILYFWLTLESFRLTQDCEEKDQQTIFCSLAGAIFFLLLFSGHLPVQGEKAQARCYIDLP